MVDIVYPYNNPSVDPKIKSDFVYLSTSPYIQMKIFPSHVNVEQLKTPLIEFFPRNANPHKPLFLEALHSIVSQLGRFVS
jgi:hypothetical protein